MDFTPMVGYEDLVTDEYGVIPMLNNTLAPGNYYLHETQGLNGYKTMNGYLSFTLDQRGNVTVNGAGRANWLERSIDGDTIVYSFYVPNVPIPVTLQKVSVSRLPLALSPNAPQRTSTSPGVVSASIVHPA